MKPLKVRAIPFLLLLLLLVPAAMSAISVFDVIRLTQEKYPDREIIRIIQLTDSRFVLKAEDTSRLKKEGVSEGVIREMLSRPAPAQDRPAVSAAQPAQHAPKSSRSSSASRDAARSAPSELPATSRTPAEVLDEIVKLTKAGLGDETVLAYAKAHRSELPAVLPNDRLNYLRDSGVSRTVILYLTAIDVRASGESPADDAVYAMGQADDQAEQPYPPPAAQQAPAPSPAEEWPDVAYDGEASEGGSYDAGYTGLNSYGNDYYPASDYLSYYGGWGYPYYGGYYYPWWPSYFYVDVSGFFGRHSGHGHGHGHDGNGHDGHGGGGHWGDGHRGGGGGGDRGPGHGGNGNSGQNWRDRPVMARNEFTQGSRQPRTDFAARGQARSMVPSRGPNQASRGNFGGPRVVGRPGFSSGAGSGAAMSRGSIGRGGRSPGVVSRPGFSGGGGFSAGGRAPIARSGGSFGGGGGRSGGFSGGGGRSGGFSGGGGARGGGRGR